MYVISLIRFNHVRNIFAHVSSVYVLPIKGVVRVVVVGNIVNHHYLTYG